MLRFLVIEGNTQAVRAQFAADYGATPGEAYGATLVSLAGGGHFETVCPADPGAGLAAPLSSYHGVAITGSALHIWRAEPESLRQIDLARAVFAAGLPFFGSCWGLQVAAVAAGGSVEANPRGRETGFARDISIADQALGHPLLAGRSRVFMAPCSHLDEVSALPEGARVLASNAMSRVQAAEIPFAGGTFWGVQYHPEYEPKQLAAILGRRLQALVDEGFFASLEDGQRYVGDLRALSAEPQRRDIAWRLGLSADITDPVRRTSELRNWIEHRVRPHAMARAA